VGIAQQNPQFALANAQEQCPPYKQAPLISRLPQPLDAPLISCDFPDYNSRAMSFQIESTNVYEFFYEFL